MKRPLSILGALLCAASPCPAVTYFLSQPYCGRSDSPFYQGIQNGTIYVEDFEDRKLNTPFVSAPWGGVIYSRGLTVDEDDGRDGKGINGYTWNTLGGGSVPLGLSLRFDFSRNEAGELPSYFGVALLDGDRTSGGADRFTQILVYDGAGNEVTLGDWWILQPRIPRGTPLESSDVARLAGIYVPGGISRVDFPTMSYVDHLQYGYSIPEPGVSMLAAVTAAFGLMHRLPRPEFRGQRPPTRNRSAEYTGTRRGDCRERRSALRHAQCGC